LGPGRWNWYCFAGLGTPDGRLVWAAAESGRLVGLELNGRVVFWGLRDLKRLRPFRPKKKSRRGLMLFCRKPVVGRSQWTVPLRLPLFSARKSVRHTSTRVLSFMRPGGRRSPPKLSAGPGVNRGGRVAGLPQPTRAHIRALSWRYFLPPGPVCFPTGGNHHPPNEIRARRCPRPAPPNLHLQHSRPFSADVRAPTTSRFSVLGPSWKVGLTGARI